MPTHPADEWMHERTERLAIVASSVCVASTVSPARPRRYQWPTRLIVGAFGLALLLIAGTTGWAVAAADQVPPAAPAPTASPVVAPLPPAPAVYTPMPPLAVSTATDPSRAQRWLDQMPYVLQPMTPDQRRLAVEIAQAVCVHPDLGGDHMGAAIQLLLPDLSLAQVAVLLPYTRTYCAA